MNWTKGLELKRKIFSVNLQLCVFFFKDNDTRTAFHLACSEGHLEVAQMLMRIPESDLNARDVCGHNTAFHFACMRGRLDIVKMFIRNAANPRLVLSLIHI